MERHWTRGLLMNSNHQLGGILLIVLAIFMGGMLLWYVLRGGSHSVETRGTIPVGGVIWERGQPLP